MHDQVAFYVAPASNLHQPRMPFRPVIQSSFKHYDRSISSFMQEHCLPGLAIAVTHNSQVVFAKGYGYADLSQGEQVTNQSLFRIASISKPVTAVAILQLAEQGRLDLDSPVLEILDLEDAISSADSKFDIRWRNISIRHLLQHRGGWDRDQSFDACFAQSIRGTNWNKAAGESASCDRGHAFREAGF